MADPAAPQTAPAPPQPAPPAPQGAAPANDTGTPASGFGLLPDGNGFVAKLGTGLRLGQEYLNGKEVPLENVPQPLPGVTFTTAQWRSSRLTLKGTLAIPHVAAGDFTVRVDREGKPSIRGAVKRSIALAALGNPELTLALSEDGAFSGTAKVEGADLLPRALKRSATATGTANLTLSAGRISGDGNVEITYKDLGAGTVSFRFTEAGRFAAEGTVRITPPLVDELSANLAVDEAGNLKADTTIRVGEMKTPVPGLTLGGGTIQLGYDNGQPTGAIADFTASYAGLGTVTVDQAAINRAAQLAGSGTFAFEIPGLETASGRIRIANGKISGSVTLTAAAFPKELPVRRPSITATYTDGVLGVSGSAMVDLGPAGTGTFSAAWSQAGTFSFGADITLTIPGLNEANVRVDYADGAISGEAKIPVSTELLPGLDGSVTVRYAQDRWSGETTLSYSADDGKLSGTITVTVAQTEAGALELGGSGQVTAQIAPRLQGTLTATILPEGGVDVSGAIEVTEPLELFPEKKVDKELFKYSQNIPLWAILVAVIRVRAGVRAGVGPGVFRNIKVEGSYTIGAEESDPSFTISGELYIPAYVEGYVALGAGLGLDVVLGSLTGGIEVVGSAGLYGAISVVPALSYADGDWGIEGIATLAAGARLTLGVNAWAEIEALWVTVWEEEWKLAEYVAPIGPDLALQAKMNYRFGSPEPPEIEFNSSDIDAEALIQGAIPKDGPPSSGAKEALDNKAEWKGALKEQKKAPVPPEVADEAQKTEKPPEPEKKKPPKKSGPPAGEQKTGPEGAAGEAATPKSEADQSKAADQAAKPDPSIPDTVPPDKLPNADQPRYPKPVTLDTLDEPPAPLPRTVQQEKEDLDAAQKTVRLASKTATDSSRLDNYFPKIKSRFRLTSLGYEGDFQKGFRVVGKINPEFSFQPDEALSGTGIPDEVQSGRITQIAFKSENLHGEGEVGVAMEAWPLGPDHPKGSGPSGQESLMSLLPTNPKVYRASDQRYIRGHLLNDNLGGPGQPVNLFPITAQANTRHHSAIESDVKQWVNEKRYWAKYSVYVENIGALKAIPGGKQSIDAKIRAEASVLDTELEPIPALTRKVTITSTYKIGDVDTIKVVQEEDKALLAEQKAREIDKAADVQLSSRHRDRQQTFDAGMYADIGRGISKHGSLVAVMEKLKDFKGFGDRSAAVLKKAFGQALAAGGGGADLTLAEDERGVFTRIANLWDQGLGDVL